MIRGAIVHMNGEQPFLVDLREMPTSSDAALVFTNARMPNGKRPTFIDHADSWIVLPIGQLRFLEVPAHSLGEESGAERPPVAAAAGPGRAGAGDEDLELDEDFLRRIREA